MRKITEFKTVHALILGFLKYLPRFMYSQKTPLKPYVN